MNIPFNSSRKTTGNALVLTMIMCLAALVTVAGVMSWSGTTARLTSRSNQYARSVAAAEAATEKVLTRLDSDFLSGGEALVNANLDSYRRFVPTSSDSSYWSDWQFNDAQGNASHTYVSEVGVSNISVLTAPYTGLFGFVSTYDVVSDASETTDLQTVVGSVFQEVKLTRIPVFQFGMYSSDDMEISCGQPFTVNGAVHSNGALYTEPDNTLVFQTDVSAVGQIFFSREPLDTRGAPAGSVVYMTSATSNAAPLTLPIGTTNTMEAVMQIIEPPPAGEDATSAMGKARYFNQVDMMIQVTATGVTASSGRFNSFFTPVPSNELALFVTTTNSFYDWRESKTVAPVDINVGMFTAWSATNRNLRIALGGRDVSSIYVYDTRPGSFSGLPAVRVYNGLVLPSLGLTIATSRPLYVLGAYNQSVPANLNTTNTSTTKPASFVADAVTILSPAWNDASSVNLESTRVAASNTVNAAIISGAVYTTQGNYSGGMENFMRFLESWSSATMTYNGSLVKMFASGFATNVWGKTNVYDPPTRHYTFDGNFTVASKLPPLTPGLQTVSRSQWATVAANQIVATNVAW